VLYEVIMSLIVLCLRIEMAVVSVLAKVRWS